MEEEKESVEKVLFDIVKECRKIILEDVKEVIYGNHDTITSDVKAVTSKMLQKKDTPTESSASSEEQPTI